MQFLMRTNELMLKRIYKRKILKQTFNVKIKNKRKFYFEISSNVFRLVSIPSKAVIKAAIK